MCTQVPTNEGLKERAELFSESKVVEFMTRIHSDIFAQPRLLVNGIRMRLVLNFNKNNFCLMGSNVDDYKLKIVDASLMIRKCKFVAVVTEPLSESVSQISSLYTGSSVSTTV